jgi:hypothetical protein
VTWVRQCQITGVRPVSAADTVLTPAVPYNQFWKQQHNLERTAVMADATIEVTGLRKRFGPTIALDGMTFTVHPGQVAGFVERLFPAAPWIGFAVFCAWAALALGLSGYLLRRRDA